MTELTKDNDPDSGDPESQAELRLSGIDGEQTRLTRGDEEREGNAWRRCW